MNLEELRSLEPKRFNPYKPCKRMDKDFDAIRDIREGMRDINEAVRDLERNRVLEGVCDIKEGIRDIEEGVVDILSVFNKIFI